MNEDFRDLLEELLNANARFVIVGAHALSAHGVPRATVDLDVFIDRAKDNARRVWVALAAFGAPLATLNISEADLLKPDSVIQLGVPPQRIDLLTGITGVSFEEAWNGRLEASFANLRVPYLGRKQLVKNKRASGEVRDGIRASPDALCGYDRLPDAVAVSTSAW